MPAQGFRYTAGAGRSDDHAWGNWDYSETAGVQIPENIMKGIEQELTGTNVDRMARDIFGFYICVR
jgi:hypothetical protein